MKETLLKKINKIEEVKANYEGKTFNAGLIDSIFSNANKVRKEADGKVGVANAAPTESSV